MSIKVELYGENLQKHFKGASENFLKSAGAYLRTTAMNSIKKKNDYKKHSKPGDPPFYHGAVIGGGNTFKKSIQYKADKDSVVIGPIAGRLGALGSLHEFGGTSYVNYIDHPRYGRIYKKGDLAPISTKHLKNYKGSPNGWKDPLTGYPVAFIEVPTKRLAEHATRLQERLLKADKRFHKSKPVSFPARPFMRPAYAKAEPYLMNLWKTN